MPFSNTFSRVGARERRYWSSVLASLSASVPSLPQSQASLSSSPSASVSASASAAAASSSFFADDEALWATFVHDVHMCCLPSALRRIIQEFSSHIPTQAMYLAHMSARSAFVVASQHHYMSTGSADSDLNDRFNYSDGCESCFDADVVRLVSHILNERKNGDEQEAMGWELILAQLQQCHVTSSGTFWTCYSSTSVVWATSQRCR
jgi:hypothetical protein